MEQRAATTPLQRTRFWLVLFSSAHVVPAAFISASVLLRQVCFGRPTLRFPCGFQSRACLVMLDAGFRSVWPIQPQLRFLISVSIGVCFVLSHSCSFETTSGHLASQQLSQCGSMDNRHSHSACEHAGGTRRKARGTRRKVRGTCRWSTQKSTWNMQKSTWNTQESTCNTQVQHAEKYVERAEKHVEHAGGTRGKVRGTRRKVLGTLRKAR